MVDVVDTVTFNSAIGNILTQINDVSSKVAAVETGLTIITAAINRLQAPVKLDKIDLTYVDGSGIKQVITLTTGSGL
jgi:hypothetical protein